MHIRKQVDMATLFCDNVRFYEEYEGELCCLKKISDETVYDGFEKRYSFDGFIKLVDKEVKPEIFYEVIKRYIINHMSENDFKALVCCGINVYNKEIDKKIDHYLSLYNEYVKYLMEDLANMEESSDVDVD